MKLNGGAHHNTERQPCLGLFSLLDYIYCTKPYRTIALVKKRSISLWVVSKRRIIKR